MENLTEKDRLLWKQAKKRVEFRSHLWSYAIVNAFFWALWCFTDHNKHEDGITVPWPVFPMLGWGIGLAFHYIGAFVLTNRVDSIEKEYEKLKKQQS